MAGSGSWKKLHNRLEAPPGEAGPGREAAYKARLAGETNRLLDKWCATAVDSVARALRAAATERAKAFRKATGHKVTVRSPAAEASARFGKYSMPSTFITLALEQAYVHLYVSRSPGEFPVLQYAIDADALLPPASVRSGRAQGPERQRLVSQEACIIARGPDGRPRLRAPGTGETGPLVKLDDIIFQVFERLVDAYVAYSADP